MFRACSAIHNGNILPVRIQIGGIHHLRITSCPIRRTGIDVINGCQTTRTAQLDYLCVSLCIHDDLFSPPSEFLQPGGQCAGKFLTGDAFTDSPLHFLTDCGQDIHPGGFGNGKGAGVRVCQLFVPVPGDVVAFGAEIRDSLLWREACGIRQINGLLRHPDAPIYRQQKWHGSACR